MQSNDSAARGTVRREHFAWLDAMRFVAAFLVLFCHSRNDFFIKYGSLDAGEQGPLTFLFYLLGRMGGEAVFTFFVLSGFLVGGPGLERIFRGTFRLRSYAVDRTVRIMLPLVSAVALFLVVAPLTGTEVVWGRVVGNLLSLQCFCCEPLVSPFWSLSYEVWFYVALAAIALIIRHNRGGYVLLSVCVVVFVRLNPLYLLMWLIGAAAYLTRPVRKSRVRLVLSIVFVVMAAAFTQMTTQSRAMSFALPDLGEGYHVVLCIAMGWMVQQLVQFKPRGRWLSAVERGLGRMACFSYTLYLTHRIVLLFVFTRLLPKEQGGMNVADMATWLLIVGACLAVAWLVYWLAERHTQTVKAVVKRRLGIAAPSADGRAQA